MIQILLVQIIFRGEREVKGGGVARIAGEGRYLENHVYFTF